MENSVEDDDNVSSSLCSLFLSKHIPYHTPKLVCSMFRSKVIISLHEDVLGLLQPLHLVLDLQIDLRLTKMVPHDSPCQKTWGLTPKSTVRFKLIISLLEEVLGLLQPLHPFLGLQINLRLTKMVPHDSP